MLSIIIPWLNPLRDISVQIRVSLGYSQYSLYIELLLKVSNLNISHEKEEFFKVIVDEFW